MCGTDLRRSPQERTKHTQAHKERPKHTQKRTHDTQQMYFEGQIDRTGVPFPALESSSQN